MKRQLKKWIFRLAATALLIAVILLIIILNPILLYANKTVHNNVTIYHNQPLNASLYAEIGHAAELLKTSELYNSNLKLDICLNDGSSYPTLLKFIRGQAFAWGFYNKVVMQGTANYQNNNVELNGYKWNLTQLLAHEITHCLQFNNLGFWKSKPIANIDNWKWEGYAEYIARQDNDQKDLSKNIERLLNTANENWAVTFADSTIAPKEYYEYWTLMQYCTDIKKMSYQQILADTAHEDIVRKQMMNWYAMKRKE